MSIPKIYLIIFLKLIDITTSLRETINKNLQGTAVNNGQTNRLNPQTNAGNDRGITVNSFITINIDKNGNVSSDIDNKTNQQNNNQEDIRKNRELTKLIEAQSTQTIIQDNLRPGGLLYDLNREVKIFPYVSEILFSSSFNLASIITKP